MYWLVWTKHLNAEHDLYSIYKWIYEETKIILGANLYLYQNFLIVAYDHTDKWSFWKIGFLLYLVSYSIKKYSVKQHYFSVVTYALKTKRSCIGG